MKECQYFVFNMKECQYFDFDMKECQYLVFDMKECQYFVFDMKECQYWTGNGLTTTTGPYTIILDAKEETDEWFRRTYKLTHNGKVHLNIKKWY